MTASEIFALGYAVPLYDIRENVRFWRFGSEEYTLPGNAVRLVTLPGVPFRVGEIAEVRKAAHG